MVTPWLRGRCFCGMPQKHLPRSQGVARRRMNLFDVPKKNGTGGLFETVKIYQFRPSSLFSDCQMGHCYIIENTYKSGDIWLIDTEHDDFKRWLDAHWQQSRVK